MDRLASTLFFDEPVHRVRLVSPARAKALEKLGIRTVRDLLTHFPRRYIDLSAIRMISEARIGESCTICATIHEIALKRPKPKLSLVEITLVDETGTLIVTAFRQPWLADRLSVGSSIAIAGTVEFKYGFKRMTNPFIEPIGEVGNCMQGVIIPVHPACEKISTAWMRRLIENALEQCAGLYDPLPLSLRTRYRLMSRYAAYHAIHFPQSMSEVAEARRRIVFEELLLLELTLMSKAAERYKGKCPVSHEVDGQRINRLAQSIPFSLTEDQAKAREEILRELAANRCANHLVLGDVGTGKTILSAFAIAASADTGCQSMLMAPTEVLARQHANSLGWLFDNSGITWELLTGSTSAHEREAILNRCSTGTVDVLIGTHALLESDVRPRNLSLVIIDEQQRFGVEQRSLLLEKGSAPDALYLTATPIPRTLALALYGDLTLSYLIQKPHSASRRITTVLTRSKQGEAYSAAAEALKRGEQVFVVCPLVGKASDNRSERGADKALAGSRDSRKSAIDREFDDSYEFGAISIENELDFVDENVKAATSHAKSLQNGCFAGYSVDLLHGKMSSQEKERIMTRFCSGDSQVLVSTTVVEVGVDVPNATVMIVEDADRFGLSQLHQLRGRVGRSEKSGEVYLISGSQTDTALDRLSAMERTEDGFELANYDLSVRREGDILGNRQHGAAALKLVNVVRDGAIIETAHGCARSILEEDPFLESSEYTALAREARLMFKGGQVKQGG